MPNLTWGYLKDWAEQNGVADDSLVLDEDDNPAEDLDTFTSDNGQPPALVILFNEGTV